MPVYQVQTVFKQPEVIYRFGNLTATSTSEVLVSARAYAEQSSQAQRSVVSTSAQDASGGSGAKKVLITYLNSSYEQKTEEVNLNGTNAVNTVATDIRFIEKFEVSQGAAAAGSIKIMTTTNGGGSEFCGIGTSTYNAFLCHHYVPTGKQAWIMIWGATVDDESKFKLMGRGKPNGTDLVDQHVDLVNLMGIATPPGFLQFQQELMGGKQLEGSYTRVTVVPNQNTSTTIRTHLFVWEESL
jgi:hypothetical protein